MWNPEMNAKFQHRVQGDHTLFYYRFFTFIRVVIGHLQFFAPILFLKNIRLIVD